MTEPAMNDCREPMATNGPSVDVQPGDDSAVPSAYSIEPTSAEATVPRSSEDRVTWLLTSVAFLAIFSVFLPYTVRQIAYSLRLGQLQASYEAAGDKLQGVSLKDVSDASQMVADRVGPSVVHITSTQASAVTPAADRAGWRHPSTSQGSGVVMDADGYIVTNAHVIQGCTDIRVKLSDGRRVAGEVVGVDRLTDMAVLKVDATDLFPADWGDSDQLEVGGLVWALGSPLGLQSSVTFGILSGKNRSFSAEQRHGILGSAGIAQDSPYHNFLQTDAAVNPGNSGGPLVDSRGRVVGINTAIVGEAYQGISFAIPSTIARPIYERICTEGQVERGWLGVEPHDITPELAERLGLEDSQGAFVSAVVPNLNNGRASPAQRAGMQAGDVIVSWDGHPIGSSRDLFARVALTAIDSTVDVIVLREGEQVTLQVTVTAQPLGEN